MTTAAWKYLSTLKVRSGIWTRSVRMLLLRAGERADHLDSHSVRPAPLEVGLPRRSLASMPQVHNRDSWAACCCPSPKLQSPELAKLANRRSNPSHGKRLKKSRLFQTSFNCYQVSWPSSQTVEVHVILIFVIYHFTVLGFEAHLPASGFLLGYTTKRHIRSGHVFACEVNVPESKRRSTARMKLKVWGNLLHMKHQSFSKT